MEHKSVLVTYSEVAPEHDAAYNRWYDDVHIPDCLKATHWLSARRYRLAPPHDSPANQSPVCRYLTVWELDTEDIEAAFAELARVGAWIQKQGRNFEHPVQRYRGTYVAMGQPQIAQHAPAHTAST